MTTSPAEGEATEGQSAEGPVRERGRLRRSLGQRGRVPDVFFMPRLVAHAAATLPNPMHHIP